MLNLNLVAPTSQSLRTFALQLLPWLIAFGLPAIIDSNTSGNLAYCLLWAFCAVGLAAMWGHGGILSFGQTAFFGLSGYTYGIVTLNLGEGPAASWTGLVGGLGVSLVAAVLLGYMIFYGRIKGVFIGIVTLSVTLVLETFMAQTAGPQWSIGEARLNGFNGMSNMPALSIPWVGGPLTLENTSFYYLVLVLLLAVYVITRRLLSGTFGLTLVAIRENPQRAEMLGVDIRRHQAHGFRVRVCAWRPVGCSLYDMGLLHHTVFDGAHLRRHARDLGCNGRA